MARKAKSKATISQVVFSRLGRIWTDVAQGEWLAWLAETKPASRFTSQGPHIKGRCPFHDDSTASFVVTPWKGRASCFGCGKAFWNPVHFMAAINESSVADALSFAKRRWNLNASVPKELFEKIRDHEVHQKYKTTLMAFFSATLLKAFAGYGNGLLEAEGMSWARPTVEYLLQRRLGDDAESELAAGTAEAATGIDPHGVWETICSRQLVGIFPPQAEVAKQFGNTSEEYKFFKSYFAEYLEGHLTIGHMLFPYDDTPTTICRFKLRPPMRGGANAWVRDAYQGEMEDFRGYYGLRYYARYLTATEHGAQAVEADYAAHLVEGEFDVLCGLVQQIRRGTDDYMVLALGGGAAQSADPLQAFGVRRIFFLQDRDAGGTKFVRSVVEQSGGKQLTFNIFNWPEQYIDWRPSAGGDARIKDCDDAIVQFGYPTWVRHLTAQQTAFRPLTVWCYEQASQEIERATSRDAQVVANIALAWGALITNEHACMQYCQAIAKDHDLDPAILRRDIFVTEDNEAEFIKRLTATLLESYYPVGVQSGEGRRRILSLWHKGSRTIDTVVLNDERSAETLISRHYGPLYEYIGQTLGDPPFIAGGGILDDTAFNISNKTKKYREYLNYALLKVAQDLPSLDLAETKGQGIHMLQHTADTLTAYMVNGRDVYSLNYDLNGFETARLDGPRHGNTIFDNSDARWLESINDTADLRKDVDLVTLFVRIHDMVKSGWSFRHQEVDSIFITAYVMSLAVMTVFSRQTAIIVNAESSSGKSQLVAGFIGGGENSDINIAAHAMTMQGYTPAAIRQNRANSSLTLCLEEFEDNNKDEGKSKTVTRVLDMLRDQISDNPIDLYIGTATGERRVYRMRFPLVCGGINPLRDAASLSRFVQFEMAVDPTHRNPTDILREKFGVALLKETRHDVVVGMLPHLLTLQRLLGEVKREYSVGDTLPAHALPRFREAIYTPVTVLKLIGQLAAATGRAHLIPPYHQFFFDFCVSRKEQMARLKTTAQNEQLFQTLLGAQIQTTAIGDKNQLAGATNLRVMLGDLNQPDDINKTKHGVYIDNKMDWLVVNWVEATQGLLAHTKYRTEAPNFLKTISERSAHYISNEDVKRANVLGRLVDVMGPCQPIDLISVFSIRHIRDVARNQRASALGAAKTIATMPPAISPDKTQIIDDIVV